ncbi:MAG: aromatic ring-hydroxylating dioxygenase subunit alpha, partial [Acidimicrobiales bacterium]|nr:aromatic ring-hydroxylating dioxygenase subunit alpha [Acidimicrobiales bacterium]
MHRPTTHLPDGLANELVACRQPADQAATLPASCYVDPVVYQIEADTVFRQGWVGVGRWDRWSEAGDYSAIDLAGVPVVVIRDNESQLRAFANSCSHRSAEVMVGDGTCSRMRCPFHAWTYALDGRLVAAPSMHRTENFERADHGLHEFAVAERHGFVFVSLEETPTPIDDWLGDFSEVHAPWPLADLVTTRRREFMVSCNWKGFAEVFNEYYHLPYVHPGSIDDTYNEPDNPENVVGAWSTHFGTTVGTGGLLEADQHRALPVI